jgi:hypothetical protein
MEIDMDEKSMDIDLDEKEIMDEVNSKCVMLEGSLVHRIKYFEQQPNAIFVFPNIVKEYPELVHFEVCIIRS